MEKKIILETTWSEKINSEIPHNLILFREDHTNFILYNRMSKDGVGYETKCFYNDNNSLEKAIKYLIKKLNEERKELPECRDMYLKLP